MDKRGIVFRVRLNHGKTRFDKPKTELEEEVRNYEKLLVKTIKVINT